MIGSEDKYSLKAMKTNGTATGKEEGYFFSERDEKKNQYYLMPPPNVTASYMGHGTGYIDPRPSHLLEKNERLQCMLFQGPTMLVSQHR